MWQWILVLVCTALLGVVFLLIDQRARFHLLDSVPGPKGLPVLGNALDIGTNPVDVLRNLMKYTKEYGNVVKLFMGHRPFVFISNVDLIDTILSSTKYIQKSIDYSRLRRWLGQGLLIANGQHWKTYRKLLTPAFHFKLLESSVEVYQTVGHVFLDILSEFKDNEVVDIFPFVSRYTLDVICESAMGVSMNFQNDYESNDYLLAIKNNCQMLIRRAFSAWKQFEFLFKYSSDYKMELQSNDILHKFSRSVIKARKQAKEEEKSRQKEITEEKEEEDDDGVKRKNKRVCFLDLLLETMHDGKCLDDEHIRAEVDTFMFAGHDTTASAISFCFYELAENPDIQDKVLEETKIAFDGNEEKIFSLKEINEMKYIEMVVKESLRKYPPVPFFARELQEPLQFGEMTLSKGSSVDIFAFGLHRDPKVYPNPEKFDPERFSPENVQHRHPYAFVPFSAGPRNCIGQKFALLELKSIVAKTIHKFELISAGPKYVPILSGEAILRPMNGINIKLRKRY